MRIFKFRYHFRTRGYIQYEENGGKGGTPAPRGANVVREDATVKLS